MGDVIAPARKVVTGYTAAVDAAKNAHEDTLQSRNAMLPQMSATGYGIDANAFALPSVIGADTAKGPLPNLRYFLTAGVTIPVQDRGMLRSEVRQSETKREQVRPGYADAQVRYRIAFATLQRFTGSF